MVEIIGAPCNKGVQELHPIIAGAEVYLSVMTKGRKHYWYLQGGLVQRNPSQGGDC